MSDFKKLFLDDGLIAEHVQRFCEENNCDNPQLDVTDKFDSYVITRTGQLPATLQVFHTNDGHTTLHYKVGKNQEFSKVLASYLAGNCIKQKFEQKPLSLNFISEGDWCFLLEYLAENNLKVSEESLDYGKRFAISKGSQKVYLHRYDNGKFLMQGKALGIYGLVASLLCELVEDKSEIIQAQLASFSVDNIKSDTLYDELRQLMPHSYEFIGDTGRAIIAPSLAFAKLHIELPDYSAFAFPALKALELYIKKLFGNHGYEVKNQSGFGQFFNDFTLKSGVKTKIVCSKTIDAIQRSYEYYSNQRHGLFHVDSNVEMTRVLEKKEEATDIVYSIIAHIDNTYMKILK